MRGYKDQTRSLRTMTITWSCSVAPNLTPVPTQMTHDHSKTASYKQSWCVFVLISSLTEISTIVLQWSIQMSRDNLEWSYHILVIAKSHISKLANISLIPSSYQPSISKPFILIWPGCISCIATLTPVIHGYIIYQTSNSGKLPRIKI